MKVTFHFERNRGDPWIMWDFEDWGDAPLPLIGHEIHPPFKLNLLDGNQIVFDQTVFCVSWNLINEDDPEFGNVYIFCKNVINERILRLEELGGRGRE